MRLPASYNRQRRIKKELMNGDLVDASFVSSALETGMEESVHYLQCQFGRDVIGGQAEYIRVVVLAGKAGERCVPTEGGTDALVFVGSHTDTIACRTDNDTEIVLAVLHRLCQRVGEVGVVATLGGVAAEVVQYSALRREVVDDLLLEVIPCVVARKSNFESFRHKSVSVEWLNIIRT